VGARLWFDGQAWTVCEVLTGTVRLQDGSAGFRTATIGDLLGSASGLDDPRGEQLPATELSAVALASLTSGQRAVLEAEVVALSALLGGDAGEDPDNGMGADTASRLRATAEQLGVSVRTAQRRLRRFEQLGPAGLVDERLLRETRPSVDPRWDQACLEVLEEFTNLSTPSIQTVIRRATQAFTAAVPDGIPPKRTVAYNRVRELDHGRYTFGEAKQRRSVAKRPQGVLGQLRPTRPGEYLLLDGYKLDVFAMEPVTMRWVNTELTVAMDLFDRSIKGMRLRPVAAKSADVASVLFQALTPQQWGTRTDSPTGPYVGVPEHLVLGTVGVLPDTIVIDHGKVYTCEHTLSVCRRLGISIQPAIPNKPTDKPALERFFRSLRLSLLDKLTGYKGPNIFARGHDVERGAFYYVNELEQLMREWVGDVYHRKAHQGLVDPLLPQVELSPQEMFNRGVAISGLLRLPAAEELLYEFLEVQWRQIHHYGVDIDNRRYDGPALNLYRGRRSTHGGAHPGKWPFLVDVDDVRTVVFQDPADRSFHRLEWRLAAGINAPFSKDAAEHTRRVSVEQQRHVDPQQAVDDLLTRWSREEVTGRRERNLALRLACQKTRETSGDDEALSATERASLPGVIDLISRLPGLDPAQPPGQGNGHADDLDVFERYYAEHPEEHLLETLDQ